MLSTGRGEASRRLPQFFRNSSKRPDWPVTRYALRYALAVHVSAQEGIRQKLTKIERRRKVWHAPAAVLRLTRRQMSRGSTKTCPSIEY